MGGGPEPLSLRLLFGVRVLPEEYRILGDNFRNIFLPLVSMAFEEFHMIST